MNKTAAITVAIVLLTGCTEMTHPATKHECDTMNLKHGSAEYNDCMQRLKGAEAPLDRAQDGHYERGADGRYYRTGN